MSKSANKSTTKSAPAAAKVTVAPVPAPKGNAAPAAAAAPVAAATKPAPQAFAGFSHPVTDTQLQAFINTQCGGNDALCGIVPLDNIQAGNPVPFLRKQGGARHAIVQALLWGFANGHKAGEPVNLGGAYQWFKSKQFAIQGKLDVLALLNGGFSASSKVWGQPFAKLVVLQPATTTPAADTPKA